MRVPLGVTLGFVRSAGLAFGGASSGFAIAGFFGSWAVGGSFGVFAWNVMQLWTQSIKGLYQFSQLYLSTRVQLESKGVT